uniref:Putative AT-rich interactive domain-containing protein 2 isoform X1 n=1 Tax=Davidia involucrata TaxID=16924 RepID=A0A5B7AZW1_DAVIN
MVDIKDGLALHNVEIVQTFKSSGFSFDLDSSVKDGAVGDSKDRLRSLFDQVLSVFLEEVSGKKCGRPIPALLGDGRSVDLFKLFWVVRKSGGFDSVSKNGLWAFVAKECELDIGVVASLKLIYLKYLDELDQWLRRVSREKSLGYGESEVVGKLDLLSLELETEFRGLLSDGQQLKNKDGKPNEFESNKNGEYIDLDNDKNEKMHMLAAGNINKLHDNAEGIINDDDENFCVDDDNSFVVSDASVAKQVFNSRKRKRESLSLPGMLDWLIQVAKNSDAPAIGTIPECSKWKEHGRKEFWAQVLLVREALLIRRHVDLHTEESLLQKKLKMHPSMYEDNVINHQSTEGLRCSKRLPSLTKSHFCPCCSSCSATSKLASPHKAEVEKSPKEQTLVSVEILATSTTDGMSGDEPLQKHVSVGPLFQAEVPEWTGVVSESDSKWLGTRIWPPENVEHNSFIEMDPIGKGRQDLCGCRLPGSMDCVRFHIAEKRMKLKLELGLVFYCWRFDRMGEEVSLSWTIEEEKRFKNMVRSNPPSLDKCFWDDAFKFFPTKTREKLVSYYFNVFLIRRRSYQNRVTPKNIDSDDDESEFGCIGDGFGYAAVKILGSKLLTCAQNKQCTEL